MPQEECSHCQESKSINQSIKELDQRIQSENSEIKNSLHFDKKSSAKIRKKCGQIIELLQRERERERERERAKLLQLESSCSCSEISWQDTPTPSENKHFEFPPKVSETSISEIPFQINKETQTTSEIDHQSFREQATKNFLNFSQIWNKEASESQQKDQLFWINLVNKNHQKFLNYQQQTNQQINNLENAYKDLQNELEDQDQVIENKNLNIIELAKDLNKLVRQLNKIKNEAKKHKAKRKEAQNKLANYKNSRSYWKNKSQASQKKSKKRKKDYQKIQEKLKQEQSKHYLTKLERDNYKNQLDTHTCFCSHNDYDTLKTQLANKDQKIRELEQVIKELRDNPPANPVNQEPKPNKSKNETNNFLLEKEQLLSTIRQQKNTIQELQTKLKNANEKEPMVVFKEVPKVDLITVQQLKNKVKIRDRTIILLLLVSGVIIILLMLNTVRLLAKKSRKK